MNTRKSLKFRENRQGNVMGVYKLLLTFSNVGAMEGVLQGDANGVSAV